MNEKGKKGKYIKMINHHQLKMKMKMKMKIKQNPPNTAEPQQIVNKSHSHAYRKPVW